MWVNVNCLGVFCCGQPARTAAGDAARFRVHFGLLDVSLGPGTREGVARCPARRLLSLASLRRWVQDGAGVAIRRRSIARKPDTWNDGAQSYGATDAACPARGTLRRLRPTRCQRATGPIRGVFPPRGLVASIVGAPFPLDALIVTVGWPQVALPSIDPQPTVAIRQLRFHRVPLTFGQLQLCGRV